MATVLLAETDPHMIDRFPAILSNHLPDVGVDVCTSAVDLHRLVKCWRYDAIAIHPILLQDCPTLNCKANRHLLAPLLITASRDDCELARRYLKEEAAFDLIVKPLIPHDAVQTVRLALWQGALLNLLVSKERATARFRKHIEAFPQALKAKEEFARLLTAYERTFHAIATSVPLLLSNEEETSLFDMAGVVERMTRQMALDRLFRMCEEGPPQ